MTTPMFWLKLAVLLVAYVAFLPINLLACLICRFVWFPGFGWRMDGPVLSADAVRQDEIRANAMFKIDAYSHSGDGPKFLGLAYAATLREDIWDVLWSMCGVGVFFRTPKGIGDDHLPPFSGDQLVGYLMAVQARHRSWLLTDYESASLKWNMDAIIFRGWPLTIPGAVFGRGWVFTPWEPCFGTWAQTFAMLGICESIWGEEDGRYRRVINVLKPFAALTSWSFDFNFWAGRVYMQTWYSAHSTSLCLFMLDQLAWGIGKTGLRAMAERYPWNPDICGMAGDSLAVAHALAEYYPHHRDGKVQPVYSVDRDSKTYFSVRSMRPKAMGANVLPPLLRCGSNYMNEENPLLPSAMVADGRLADWLFLRSLLRKA